MQLYESLYNLYEQNKSLVLQPQIDRFDNEYCLLPPGDYVLKAAIQVTVDLNGKLQSIIKNERKIPVLASPQNNARTSNPAPLALFDKVEYLTDTSLLQLSAKTQEKNTNKRKIYSEQLHDWIDYASKNQKNDLVLEWLTAISEYLSKDTLISDIDKSIGLKSFKTANIVYFDIMDLSPHLWYQTALAESWWNFVCKTQSGTKGLDLITGNFTDNQATVYSKGLGGSANNSSKLISYNDNDGYTYHGILGNQELKTNGEAHYLAPMDATNAAKSENMLLFLRQTQSMPLVSGSSNNTTSIVIWSDNNEKVNHDTQLEVFAALGLNLSNTSKDNLDESTGQNDATAAMELLRGEPLGGEYNSHINLLTVNATSTGRLSVVDFQSITLNEFKTGFKNWQNRCNYRHIDDYKQPNLKQMSKMIYADKQTSSDKGASFVSRAYSQLLNCMLNNTKIPSYIIRLATKRYVDGVLNRGGGYVRRCSAQWNDILLTLVNAEKPERNDKLMSDKSIETRDYKFGKLLATIHLLENDALYKRSTGGIIRQTNAQKALGRLGDQPANTIKVLVKKVNPYFKDDPYLVKEIMKQLAGFDAEEMTNEPLKAIYLVAYGRTIDKHFEDLKRYKQETDKNIEQNG
ncbi:type I-C CRISPR-associated protein Cas8c/Csd1 [Paucilactobacillus suebicus]|uniref:CRISPR-associated RAMP Csd1 family protein n=1 Tax=Paucilactobacillus suebicus DSM 5007 = KCTC 3549 TaxID=1423807 RepID=A0A0R1W3F0_9LACO|nr:type I-C CRISPR-associated protein Cas8c/Csd1 [Paucilactobacillus suebicus]KRM12369.1 CRISPR-associated RAMP Csd1 family protein [Paucilactobacillus suebicus DSM 5007 = KCTC 3549]